MSFPYLVPSSIPIAGIVDIVATNGSEAPIVVLTDDSLHLLDPVHKSPLCKHVRSAASVEVRGFNVKVKVNKTGKLISVITSKSFLLIYSIMGNNGTDMGYDEVFSVYNSSSTLLQNGLVLEKQLSFFNTNPLDLPIHKATVRFKVLLKVAHGVRDVVMLDKYEIVLVTDDNVQLINLESDEPVTLSIEGVVRKVSTLNEDLLAFKDDGSVQLIKRSGRTFVPMETLKVENVTDCAINENFSLITFVSNDSLVYYNYELHEIIKVLPFKDIKSLQWVNDGDFLLILSTKETWSLLSTFGCKLFDSSDHDYSSPWLTAVKTITISADGTELFSSDGEKFFSQRLLRSTSLSAQINHDLDKPVLVVGSEVHVYTGHEMAVASTKAINWHILKIPFEQSHQLPNIKHTSVSSDGKYLAVANSKALLLYSYRDRDWSFYQNDYFNDLTICHLTWFGKLNLLILGIKLADHSEIVIFDLRKFKSHERFASEYVVFRYDLPSDIQLINVTDNDIVVYTDNGKFYHIHVGISLTGLKIDLLKVMNHSTLLKSPKNLRSVIKISKDVRNHDILVLNNGELILFREHDSGYRQHLLFDTIEYVYKLNDEEYYMFNGEHIFLVKNLTELIKTRDPSNTVLKLKPQAYPLLLILKRGLFVTLENILTKRKNIELNTITTNNSIFLQDMIRFELTNSNAEEIYQKYCSFKNFPFAMELLLYQTVTNDEDLTNIIKLIQVNPLYELNVVSKCLRKIETQYWDRLLKSLGVTPSELVQKAITMKEWRTLGILVVIFLNYDTANAVMSIEEESLISIMKLIYDNAQDDDELWETSFEMLRFLKLLDPTCALLKRCQSALTS